MTHIIITAIMINNNIRHKAVMNVCGRFKNGFMLSSLTAEWLWLNGKSFGRNYDNENVNYSNKFYFCAD